LPRVILETSCTKEHEKTTAAPSDGLSRADHTRGTRSRRVGIAVQVDREPRLRHVHWDQAIGVDRNIDTKMRSAAAVPSPTTAEGHQTKNNPWDRAPTSRHRTSHRAPGWARTRQRLRLFLLRRRLTSLHHRVEITDQD
jgi:hypothetical protein